MFRITGNPGKIRTRGALGQETRYQTRELLPRGELADYKKRLNSQTSAVTVNETAQAKA